MTTRAKDVPAGSGKGRHGYAYRQGQRERKKKQCWSENSLGFIMSISRLTVRLICALLVHQRPLHVTDWAHKLYTTPATWIQLRRSVH